jgi:putative ABC transport system permease protein
VPVLQDVRIAFRLFRRTPVPTVIALLSIAIGIGATAVVFTAIKTVLLEPLPYARPAGLVQLRSEMAHAGQSQGDWVFWNEAQEIARRTRTLESVAVYGNAVFDLAGDGGAPPEAHYGLRVSANLFPTLGVSPMLGRGVLPGEDRPGGPNEMVLSYGLWSSRFNRDPHVAGRTVDVNGRNYLIIGVMAAGFNFPLRREATHTPAPYVEFWAPLQLKPEVAARGALGGVARLRAGVSIAQAQQDLATISASLAREFPATNRDKTLDLASLRERALGKSRDALWLLMAAASLFLLIGCANVANLLLARGFARRREISIRMALGAARTRIARQLLTESCALAILGGLAGYALAAAAWQILPAIAPVTIPRLAAARADWSILAFSLAAALLNGILFGMAPALRAAAAGDFAARGAASGKHDRVRGALVAAEVAIAVTLVLTGGQLLAGFLALIRTDPGFQPDRVFAAVVLAAPERYPTPPSRGAIYQRFLDSVRGIPGVESAGTVDALPFSGENHGGFIAPGIAGEIDVVSPQYLQTMGVRLESGRWFGDEDMQPSSDAVIVNGVTAALLWPGTSATGKSLCLYCTPERPSNWKRVVGVVSSMRHAALEGPDPPNVYLATAALQRAQFLVVRTAGPARGLDPAFRRAIAAVDPHQAVLLSASMRTLVADTVADRRFLMTLLAITACLALLMAAAGIYGVTSYTTSLRTQEIGIRMALGATPAKVHALIFRHAFLAVAAGLATGLVCAAIALRLLRGILWGLAAGTVPAVWMAAAFAFLTAALACWLPARRATRIDPMAALRQD